MVSEKLKGISRDLCYRLRPVLHSKINGNFLWFIAALEICIPLATAMICFKAMTPEEINVNKEAAAFMRSCRFLTLIVMVSLLAYAAMITVCVVKVHAMGPPDSSDEDQ